MRHERAASGRGGVRWLALGLWLAGLGLLLTACGEPEEIPAEEAARIRATFDRGLASPDPYVRAETVRAIGSVGSPALRDLLGSATSDGSRVVRLGATVQMARVDPGAVRGKMVDFVTDSDPRVQLTAITELLRVLPDGPERDDVIKVGLQSSSPAVKRRAMTHGVLPRFAEVNRGEDGARKRDLKDELSRLVDDPDPVVAGSALNALVAIGFAERAEPLLGAARGGEVRAIQALAEADVPGRKEALQAAFDGGSKAARIEAAIVLVGLGESGPLDSVRQMLGAADPETTSRALLALGRGQSDDGLRILRPYRDDSRAEVRGAVYRAMRLHKGARGDDFLRGLRDTDETVVFAAMAGMCATNPSSVPRSVGEFVTGIDDPKLEVRRAAESQARSVLEGLLSTLDQMTLDGEVELLGAVERQLPALAPTLKKFLASQAPDTRVAAAELLFRAGDPEATWQGLEAPGDEVRFAYVDALAFHPPKDEPLKHLSEFRSAEGVMTVMDVVAGAGIWTAYRANASR